ncbi:MAG TPA: hypothetical protein VG013_10770 [Gemmataceae bacterium]|jgi:uncharacterized protein (TIGR03067 family)|nr:hypothetical protein [Gemmataceae bacterium]
MFAVASLALLALTGLDANAATTRKVAQLEGVWEVVSLEPGGKTWTRAPSGRIIVLIKGDHVAVAGDGFDGIETAYFEIGPRKQTVNLFWQGQLLSIYRLHGDQLTVCVGMDKGRPRTFSGGGDRWLIKLKRQTRWTSIQRPVAVDARRRYFDKRHGKSHDPELQR